MNLAFTTNANGVTAATSNNVAVSPNAAAQLVFLVQPTNTGGTMSLNPAVKVAVEDGFGNVLTSDNTDQVTLALGTNPSGATLSGTLMQTVSNGVATFNNLSVNKAGTGYTLTARDTPLTVTSNAFNSTLVVTSLKVTATGFTVTFSDAFNDTTSPTPQINLYDASNINAGARMSPWFPTPPARP